MVKKWIGLILLLQIITSAMYAEDLNTKRLPEVMPGGIGLELSTGLIGIYAPVNIAMLFPKLNERINMGVRGSWGMLAIVLPHYNYDKTELLGYLPWMVYGSYFLQIGQPLLKQILKPYLGVEVGVGSTFATDEGLIGKNITVGMIVYGGLEFFIKPNRSLFLEGGISTFLTFVYGEEQAIQTLFHGGFGFFIRFGPRFYFGRN
jgi:hypothetical protein